MNQFKDATLAEAKAAGCDTVQIKYQGLWTRNEISKGLYRAYSHLVDTIVHFNIPSNVDVTLIGNRFSSDLSTLWVFDCWSIDNNNVKEYSYRDRYALAHAAIQEINLPIIKLVKNYPIQHAYSVWNDLTNPEVSCGIVFRKSSDLWNGEILLQRKYQEIPCGLL